IYGEESAQNRKNKFDFDNKHQNRTYFLFEKELLSHSPFFAEKNLEIILTKTELHNRFLSRLQTI
ncbi:hypothetical protein, partial [Enterococcus hirae]|uniref:hypothetical protein n=1 Tax=Enterococcus hirae TaxID=1354 RepID=UPI0019D40752